MEHHSVHLYCQGGARDESKNQELGRYLRRYGQHIGLDSNFGIADTSDSKAVVKRIIKSGGYTIDCNIARSRISSCKAKSISSDQYAASSKNAEQQEFAMVYSEYESVLKASNLLDYDDLLLRCAHLLQTHPQCVSNVEAVLIDEFQDTNIVQLDLMNQFAQYKKHITIVGDPDQSIYGFRFAEIMNLNRMQQQHPDTLIIHLEENYRSSGAILASAQQVIEQDENRPNKRLQATHGRGERPILRRLPTAAAEAEWLVTEIKRCRALSGNLLEYGDFAILLRSAILSRLIESVLGKEGIPYRMVGGTRFFDRVEVKIVLDYLRIIDQPNHNDAVLRVINVPPRGIGEQTVKNLSDEAESEKVSLWSTVLALVQGRTRVKAKISVQAMKGLSTFVSVILTSRKRRTDADSNNVSLADLIAHVTRKTGLEDYLKGKYKEDFDGRWASVQELVAQAADMDAALARGEEPEEETLPAIEGLEQRAFAATQDGLSVFLANVALSTEVQKSTEDGAEAQQQVTISTIHAAKGLEWAVVFIPACYEGSIPHSRAEDTNEERRLLYVAMTRAQVLLYLSCPVKNSKKEDAALSSFVASSAMSVLFAQQGPVVDRHAVASMAKVLRRECPTTTGIAAAQACLHRDADDYWPLDGEQPTVESRRWDAGGNDKVALPGFNFVGVGHRLKDGAVNPIRAANVSSHTPTTMQNPQAFSTASTTMRTGFVSATVRMEELERVQEESQLRLIDQRQKTSVKRGSQKTNGTQGNLLSFFGKQPQTRTTEDTERMTKATDVDEQLTKKPKISASFKHLSGRLADVSSTVITESLLEATRKPRTVPYSVRLRDTVQEEDTPDTRSDLRSGSHPTLEGDTVGVEGATSTPYVMQAEQATRKPRTAPFGARPRETVQEEDAPGTRYILLSSSPPTVEDSTGGIERITSTTVASPAEEAYDHGVRNMSHTASLQQSNAQRPPVRRTLGMRRSLQGWSARKGKG
ncbi:ATP-dependent DNA helicase srs2 [Elasticomyces elasticus]|nr:ATP-dependent DNA helicase srs2 [Elasticomyces elasticus]